MPDELVRNSRYTLVGLAVAIVLGLADVALTIIDRLGGS